MNIQLRNITFTIYRPDGNVNSFTREIAGDDVTVQWATDSIAEVNECGCTAQFQGKQIAVAGNVQS